jgi:hypothetical protein
MTASPRRMRTALCALLFLIPPLLAGCDPYTIPDRAPRCAPGVTTPVPAPTASALSGSVRFGTSINPNLTVHDPRTSFGIHQMVAWIARFSHPINSGHLNFVLVRNECGRWVRVYTGANIGYSPNQKWQTRGIVPALRLEFQIIHLGTYQVRYVNRGAVVAEGMFILH